MSLIIETRMICETLMSIQVQTSSGEGVSSGEEKVNDIQLKQKIIYFDLLDSSQGTINSITDWLLLHLSV